MNAIEAAPTQITRIASAFLIGAAEYADRANGAIPMKRENWNARYRRAAGIEPPIVESHPVSLRTRCLIACQSCAELRGVHVDRLYVLCEAERERCHCPHGLVVLGLGRCPLKKWEI